MKRIVFVLICWFLLPYAGEAQNREKKPGKPNWYNLDLQEDGMMGISTEKAYRELLAGKKGVPVVVAVIDGGTDIHHEDLKEVIWENPSPGQQQQGNVQVTGYTGDKHGWNFIGNASGEHVQYDNLEMTRLLRELRPKYISVLPTTPLPEKERREFQAYQKMTTEYADKLQRAQMAEISYGGLKRAVDTMMKRLGTEKPTLTQLNNYKPEDPVHARAMKIVRAEVKKEGDFSKFYEELNDGYKYFSNQINYHLNMEYDPRHIVGDNYEDSSERYYGNADVIGPDAEHGTHVAGIIAAKRQNGIGIDGVADQAKIMVLRTVPDGDERDKDVANSIRYAVENGAKIINMSFGKGYVKDRKVLEEAIQFAASNDVLLVHAAGNDGQDNDKNPNFPNRSLTDSLGINQGVVEGWIEVGASGWTNDGDLVAPFSNYGRRSVDVFAPGMQINSTMPGSAYKEQDGTSMAAPVVSGLAALIRSYYPQFTAREVKEIIMKSVVKPGQRLTVREDGARKRVKMKDISVSGGVVNAYQALKLADKLAAKKG